MAIVTHTGFSGYFVTQECGGEWPPASQSMEAAAGLYYAAMQPWPRKDKLGGTVVIAVLVSHLDKQPEASLQRPGTP